MTKKQRNLNKTVIHLVREAFKRVAESRGIDGETAEQFFNDTVLGRHTDNPLTTQGLLFKSPFNGDELNNRREDLVTRLDDHLSSELELLSTDSSIKVADVIVIEAFDHISTLRKSPKLCVHLLSA